jgi:hypothetical protein
MSNTPTPTPALAAALAKAQAEIRPAHMDRTNPHLRTKYASLASVQQAARPIFDHGLSYVQLPDYDGQLVRLTTRLQHESGEFIEFTTSAPLAPGKQQIQALGSTISYLRRYALSSLLGIAAGDDDDGESYTKPHEVTRRPRSTPSQMAQKVTAQQRQAPTAPPQEPQRSKNPLAHYHATTKDLGIEGNPKRWLVGGDTLSNATPETLERMDALAFALKRWEKSGRLSAVLELAQLTTADDLRAAWAALQPDEQALLAPCKDYLKTVHAQTDGETR